MRSRSTFMRIFMTILVLLSLAVRAAAQENVAASGKTSKSTSETHTALETEKENWSVLNDLKTGLEPASYAEMAREEQPEFVRQTIRVQWRAHDPIDLYVIRPKVAGKVPVVLYLYSYQDTDDRFRDNGWCKRATADGFAAVGFVSDLTDYRFRFRPLKQWFVSELAESVGGTVHDVQFLLNYLAGRGDMDMDRVGMFGKGSGASIAILAAHADPRIKTLDLLDPWGDWPEWLKESPLVGEDERSKFLTPEFLKSVTTLDPVAYLPSLKNAAPSPSADAKRTGNSNACQAAHGYGSAGPKRTRAVRKCERLAEIVGNHGIIRLDQTAVAFTNPEERQR